MKLPIESIPTAVEPGITAEQADRIMELATKLSLDGQSLAAISYRVCGWPWWPDLDGESAEDLITELAHLWRIS